MMFPFCKTNHTLLQIAQMAVCLFLFPHVLLQYRNTDKMSDEEKIPIALAGLAGISLPFIFGMVALYAAQG